MLPSLSTMPRRALSFSVPSVAQVKALPPLKSGSAAPVLASTLFTARPTDRAHRPSLIDRLFNRLSAAYTRLLEGLVKRVWIGVALFLALLGASALFMTRVKQEFVPYQDRGGFFISVVGPEGASFPAMLDVMGQARPAAFNELLIGLFEASRGFHTGFAPGAALGVTHTVQRSQNLLAELGAFFEDGVDHVWSGVLAARQALVVRFITQQFVANETNVTQGGLVVRHNGKPLRWIPSSWGDRLGGRSRDHSRLPGHEAAAEAIKQAFETYVYANPLSSAANRPTTRPDRCGAPAQAIHPDADTDQD